MFVEKNSSGMNSFTIEQHEFNDWIIVPTLFSSRVESTKKKFSNVSNIDSKSSLFESSGSMDYSDSRSSDRSSKDDSGVNRELRRSTSISDHINTRKNEDKCIQTCITDEDSQDAMEKIIEQVKNSADLNK